MIFTKKKEGVRAIRAMKYKKCVARKYTQAPVCTFGAEVHKSIIQVKRMERNKYENGEFISKDTTFVEMICSPSPIILKYRLMK